MRNHQFLAMALVIVIEQQVQIDDPIPPMLDASSTKLLLQLQQHLENGRQRQGGFESKTGVKKRRTLTRSAHRPGTDQGAGHHILHLLMAFQLLSRLCKHGRAIADIGSERNETVWHGVEQPANSSWQMGSGRENKKSDDRLPSRVVAFTKSLGVNPTI